MDKVCFHRLRWNSKWMLLSVPLAAYGLYCLLGQFWHGFHPAVTVQGLICLCGFAPCLWYGLQTIHITDRAVTLKLGPLVLRQLPLGDIRTLTSVSVGLNGFNEIWVILSPRPLEEMVALPSEDPRGDLHKYFDTKRKLLYLPPSEGIWLQDPGRELEKLFPNAENFVLRPDQGGARHG